MNFSRLIRFFLLSLSLVSGVYLSAQGPDMGLCTAAAHYSLDVALNPAVKGENTRPQSCPGVHQAAMEFDGKTHHLEFPYGSFDKARGSLAFWIKPRDLQETGGLWSVYTSDLNRYMLSMHKGELRFAVGAPNMVMHAPLKCEPETWHHIVLCYDFPRHHFMLFQNGKILTESHNTYPMLKTEPSKMYFGTGYDHEDHDRDGSPCDYRFRGAMDELKFFACVLQPQQIKALYGEGLAALGLDPDTDCLGKTKPTKALSLHEKPAIEGSEAEAPLAESLHSGMSIAPSSGFSLFPNPAREILNYKIHQKTNLPILITVCDASGKVVFRESISPEAPKEGSLDLSHLADGLYLFTIFWGNEKQSMRFVLE